MKEKEVIKMDRAYRRLVLLLGIIICLPSVVNTHAMSANQYSKLEYMLTQVGTLQIESTLSEPHRQTDRLRHICTYIGQLIKGKLFCHSEILEQHKDFHTYTELTTDVPTVQLGKAQDRETIYETIDIPFYTSQEAIEQPIDSVSFDLDHIPVSNQVFTAYKVILSKMNNKAISC